MTARVKVLRQLIRDSLYVIDEQLVADAILLRIRARETLLELGLRSHARGPQIRSFRRHARGPQIRSFRRHDDVRSLRLTGAPRRWSHAY